MFVSHDAFRTLIAASLASILAGRRIDKISVSFPLDVSNILKGKAIPTLHSTADNIEVYGLYEGSIIGVMPTCDTTSYATTNLRGCITLASLRINLLSIAVWRALDVPQRLLLADLYRTSISNDASWATRLSSVAQSRPQLYRDIIVTGDTVP